MEVSLTLCLLLTSHRPPRVTAAVLDRTTAALLLKEQLNRGSVVALAGDAPAWEAERDVSLFP